MNKITLAILLFFTFIWAVQPVPKTDRNDKKPVIEMQIPDNNENQEKTQAVITNSEESKDSKNDHFIDTDSNNVNDQREEDLLKIKQLKKKFKDLFKKEKEPQIPKTPGKRTK